MTKVFSLFDLDRLRADPSSERRAEIAGRLGAALDQHTLSPGELAQAQDIFGILAQDVATEVRAALAHALRHSKHLTRSVAFRLATDVDSVAIPVLADSLALTDEDLLEIVRRGSPAAQTAIAGRANVAEPVSAALVLHGDEAAVGTLMRNPTSQVSADTCNVALDRFPDSDTVKDAMATRPTLPPAVAERLVTMVSDELQHYLVVQHNLPRGLAADLMLRGRETAVLRVSKGLPPDQLASLVSQVAARGRLTPTLLLRALCTGDAAFFEVGMASLCSIPVANARTLLYAAGNKSFAALYSSSRLPKNLFLAFRAAIDVIKGDDGAPGEAQPAHVRVIDRFNTLVQGEAEPDIRAALACLRAVTDG